MSEKTKRILLSCLHRAFWIGFITYDEYLSVLNEIDPEE